MPRLLHIADLHLGWRPRDLDDARADARRDRRDALFDQAVRTALDEGVDAVVIAGDLFETFDPERALVERVIAGLERLQRAGVATVTVPGNHDELTYATSVYRTMAERWPGVLVTSPTPTLAARLEIAGEPFHVHGLAYVGGITDVRNALASVRPPEGGGTHVFVAHGTLVGPGGSLRAGERSLPLDRDALGAAGFDYVALGHLHVPSSQRLGRSLAVYAGCVGGKGLDDPGCRHWTVVDVRPGGAEVGEIAARVQVVRHETLDVTGASGADAVLDAVRRLADPDALVRVRLVGALPAALDAAALEAGAGGGFFHLEVRDGTTTVSEDLLDAWASAPTVRGAFVRRLRQRHAEAATDAERGRATRGLLHGLAALRDGP